MTSIAPVVTLSPREYDAVLFDLDGVLTRTASVHAAAWKRLFDGLLEQRAADTGEALVPFDIDADYRRSVDGKPRYDGAASFLESRGIALPCGTPEDGPGTCTMHAMVVYGYGTENSEARVHPYSGWGKVGRASRAVAEKV
jgi:phosphoglycolate phosphatase-like HAD superfamily hydrolase